MIVDAARRFLDHPGELALAGATIVALAAVVAGLPLMLRPSEAESGRSRVTPSLVMLTGGAAVTFAAYLAFELRCGTTGCRQGAGGGFAGLHRWWRTESSWAWGAQLLVASLGLAAAAVAFWLSARGSRRARWPLWWARLLYVAWAVFVFLVPAAYELSR
jgi:hypothetical protein